MLLLLFFSLFKSLGLHHFCGFFEFRFASNNSSLFVKCEPYWFRVSNYNSIEINSHFQHMLLTGGVFFFFLYFSIRAIVFLVHLESRNFDDGFFWSLQLVLLFSLRSLCGHSIIWLYCFGFLACHPWFFHRGFCRLFFEINILMDFCSEYNQKSTKKFVLVQIEMLILKEEPILSFCYHFC